MIRNEFVSWMHSACELGILFVMDEDDTDSGAVMHVGIPLNLGAFEEIHPRSETAP